MKKIIVVLIIFLYSSCLFAGDWNNIGGNSKRNGLSDIPGPDAATVLWQGTTLYSAFGCPVYIEGNKVVTMRFTSATNAPVVCHNLYTGQLLWSADVTYGAGRSLPLGIKNGKVYVMRLTESYNDSLFALDAATGNRIWSSLPGVATYITGGAVFAPNGDLIIDGNSLRLLRINHTNGSTVWSANVTPLIGGQLEPVIYNNTVYTWRNIGGAVYIQAIDLATGLLKYNKQIPDTYPGGPNQQTAFMAGNNGIIFAYKEGDNLTALQDNGSALNILWTTPIAGDSPFSTIAEGPDSTIYVPSSGKILRLGKTSGAVLDSSITLGGLSLFTIRIAVGSDGKVYAAYGSTFLCANPNLTTIFTQTIAGLNTSGIALGPNNTLAIAGNGTDLRVYKTSVTIIGNENTAAGYELFQNYPNPFNNETIINYNLPVSGYVTLKVYDLTGREVETLVNGNYSPGNYKLTFKGDKLSSGIYFYKLFTGNKAVDIKKMILLK
jgi:outer membrane protein assembly factor BamB